MRNVQSRIEALERKFHGGELVLIMDDRSERSVLNPRSRSRVN
jgi:hypothetical protein